MLLAVVAVLSLAASAQNLYLGGSVAAWRDGTDHQTNIKILPEIGYTLSESAAVGAVVGWDYYHQSGANLNLFTLAPYYRYNFVKVDRVKLFCDGGIDLGFGKAKAGDYKSKTAVTYGIGFKPGVSVSVSYNVSLVAHFGFLGYKDGNNAAKDAGEVVGYSYGWGFKFSNELSFGFYYNF